VPSLNSYLTISAKRRTLDALRPKRKRDAFSKCGMKRGLTHKKVNAMSVISMTYETKLAAK
jgi:hypothetical protein